ncbi:MAG: RNA polymerase sigma-70 factor [Bacteroidota bacterium]
MKESENHMVKRLRAGHEGTYAQLFHEYYRPLTVFANKYVNDLDSARELVQDLFVSMYENRKSLLISTSLKSYLYQSVRNRCLNHLKRIKVGRQHLEQIGKYMNSHESLEELILENELENRIFQIISRLSPKCREVFTLSRVHGLKNQEIAVRLELSIRTVETHISNALKILRTKLEEE